MSDTKTTNEVIRFRVKLGHNCVTVECRTQEEAIQEARKRLCQELPRMWDVIQSMDEDQFDVDRAA